MTQLEMELPVEKPWMSVWVGSKVLAIFPFGERALHELAYEDCPCRPSVEYPSDKGLKVIVHNPTAR